MTLRILADDPATKNYGRVLLTADVLGDRIKFKIKKAWLVKHTIKSELIKTDIASVLRDYAEKTEDTLAARGPFHLYCAERFMPRGGGGTVQHGEAIAMMLALNVQCFGGTVSKLIPAVTWKTQLKRYYDLKELYAKVKPCPDHLLDATFIGLYSVYAYSSIKPYSTLTEEDVKYIVKKLKKIGRRMKVKEDCLKAAARRKKKEEKNERSKKK